MPYNSTIWVRNIVRSLMALPLLYQNLIEDQFDQIANLFDERVKQAKTAKRTTNDLDESEKAREELKICVMLRELLNYFESYWMNEVTPEMFSVRGLQYRTNNAVEGKSSLFFKFLLYSVLV